MRVPNISKTRLSSRLVGRYLFLILLFLCIYAIYSTLCHLQSRTSVPASSAPKWRGGDNCRLPPLPLNPPELRPLFHAVPDLQCDPEPAWVTARGSTLTISETARLAHGHVTCQFADLLLEGDERAVEGFQTSSDTEYILEQSDFVRVSCSAEDGAMWSNIVAGVRRNAAPRAVPLPLLSPNHLRLNVLVWGFDSLSRNMFLRKLPRTAAFLRDTLGAVVLEGYNIVGDGTPQALIPMLTGKTEQELPNTRRRSLVADFVNVYPFVWKDFEADGYVTAFNEDQPLIGTFQYRLRGFNPQPTTHYMRTYFLAAHKEYSEHQPYCMRDTPRHKVMSDYVENLYTAYPNRAKFIFSFHSELSHDDINLIGVADNDMTAFLQRMWSAGHLNNTALIVMADHGHRFTEIRSTQQGKLEERLPFFSWALPRWVREMYPESFAALQRNAGRLSTPFDQYQTLQHLRSWPAGPAPDPHRRAVSLLMPSAPSRGCAAAGVEPHWCACLRWRPVSRQSPAAVSAARAFESYVNALQEQEAPGLCAPLRVEDVLQAEVAEPQPHVLNFVKSIDYDGFQPDLSGAMDAQRILQLRMRAAPGDRLFEATMTENGENGLVNVRHEDVSRVDRYGRQARCVEGRMDYMRKLCFCLE